MASRAPTPTVEYVQDHRLVVDLTDAHARSVADLEHDFNPELEDLGYVRGIAQGFAHEIHDIVSQIFPRVDSLNVSRIHVEEMMKIHDIARMEGSMFQKIVIIAAMMDSVAEEVASAIWKHEKGESIEDMLTHARIVSDEAAAPINDEWEKLYARTKKDFGL